MGEKWIRVIFKKQNQTYKILFQMLILFIYLFIRCVIIINKYIFILKLIYIIILITHNIKIKI